MKLHSLGVLEPAPVVLYDHSDYVGHQPSFHCLSSSIKITLLSSLRLRFSFRRSAASFYSHVKIAFIACLDFPVSFMADYI